MLLFINVCECMAGITIKFQYITCYSLSECVRFGHPPNMVSIHHMLLFILKSVFTGETETCFNTSHVTLYPYKELREAIIAGFQYITCYSLSYIYDMDARTQDTFQYITCYSLSPGEHRGKHPENLFQYITCYSLSVKVILLESKHFRFNTSHVTLYRCTEM